MPTRTAPAQGAVATTEAQASWMPMIIIALAQIQLAFNVGALQVSIDSRGARDDRPERPE
ncbi:MAG: hypothetical protein SNJ69_08795 [Chloroflexaceae bacterium]